MGRLTRPEGPASDQTVLEPDWSSAGYDAAVDHQSFGLWLEQYFGAWASSDRDEVEALFAEDAEYSWGPFRETAHGREAIINAWVDGGAPAELRWHYEPIAVEGDRGIAHWNVVFRGADRLTTELDGILVCSFDNEARCSLHREWYDRREFRVQSPDTERCA
jgi:SnoaL-like domain